MKKKLLILFAAVLAVLPAAAQSVTLTYGEGLQQYSLTFTATGEGTASVSNFGSIYDRHVPVVIPGEVEIGGSTYTVTTFGDTFKESGYVTSLVIPGSITTIGSYALERCVNLVSVEFLDGVQSISGGAFSECSALAAIKLRSATPPTIATGINPSFPASTTCTVTVPYGTEETYRNSAWSELFSNFTSIASVEQDGMKFTITSAADKTAEVEQSGTIANALVIPSSVTIDGVDYVVTEIKKDAFYRSSLTSVVIPNTVTTIGIYAFFYCDGLTSVVIPNSVTSIGESAFNGCSKLKSVEISNSISTIERKTFYKCSSLESVVIPSSVTFIGTEAFYDCSKLADIYLLATTPTEFNYYYNKSFQYLPSTVNIYVPYNAYDAYVASDWAKLGSIQEPVSQPKGSGSSADPYLVASPEELLWISLRVNDGTQSAYFYTELTDDIDLKGRNWTPIGTELHPFLGSFDGKGHSITNMKIVATADYQGLFGKANGDSPKLYIKNLNLAGTITTDNNPHNYIGGLVGMSQGKYSNVRNIIENVHSSVNITSDQNLAHVGGIVGNNTITDIHRCSYSGEISLPNCNSCVAGIAGYSYYTDSFIDDCIFTGSVTISESGNQCGGIVGYINQGFNSVQIKNNLSLGTISPQRGMIIGDAKEAIEGCMTNNYAPEGTTLYGGAQASNCQGATVSADQLKSGEVCWLLNGSKASGAWHQTIGKDDTPVLDPMHATVFSETQTIDAPAQNAYLLSFCRHMNGTVTGAKVYEFAGILGTDVYGTLVSGGKIQAGKPYILVLDQAGASYKFDSGYSNDWTTEGQSGDYGIQAVLEDQRYEEMGETFDYYLACYEEGSTNASEYALVFSQNKIMRAKSLSDGGTKVAIGKCYILAADAFIKSAHNNAPVRLTFFDETTGIEDVTETDASPIGQTFNLQGVRVGTDYKGIVIINGKKVLRK